MSREPQTLISSFKTGAFTSKTCLESRKHPFLRPKPALLPQKHVWRAANTHFSVQNRRFYLKNMSGEPQISNFPFKTGAFISKSCLEIGKYKLFY